MGPEPPQIFFRKNTPRSMVTRGVGSFGTPGGVTDILIEFWPNYPIYPFKYNSIMDFSNPFTCGSFEHDKSKVMRSKLMKLRQADPLSCNLHLLQALDKIEIIKEF